MGLFKWSVRIGQHGEGIADGYIYSSSEEEAIEKLRKIYSNEYHNIVIEDDWKFNEDDIADIDSCTNVTENIMIVWED